MSERARLLRAGLAAATEAGIAAVPLSGLSAGRAARLHRRELSEGESCLLTAMGITDGCKLMVRVAGDPCIVEVRTTRIGLARSIAERIFVFSEVDAEAGEVE